MAEWREGYPVALGDTHPIIDETAREYFTLARVRPDGSRRVVPRRLSSLESSGRIRQERPPLPVSEEDVGAIVITSGVGSDLIDTSDSYDKGIWITLPDSSGHVETVREPATHVESFYKFVRILGEHCQKFLVEYDPANLRSTDHAIHRIEHLNHELSNADREKAGNVSEQVRPLLGYLWHRVHEFANIPIEDTATWKLERARLKILIEDHLCEVCQGSGLSYRLMADHPRSDWKAWLEAGLRFTVDKALNATLIEGAPLATNAVKSVDILNFNNALDWYGRGEPADDFLKVPRHSIATPPPESPSLPVPTQGHQLNALRAILWWQRQYNLAKRNSRFENEGFAYRSFVWSMLAFILTSYENDTIINGEESNRWLTASRFWAGYRGNIAFYSFGLRTTYTANNQVPWNVPFRTFTQGSSRAMNPAESNIHIPDRDNAAEVNALADKIDTLLGDATDNRPT